MSYKYSRNFQTNQQLRPVTMYIRRPNEGLCIEKENDLDSEMSCHEFKPILKSSQIIKPQKPGVLTPKVVGKRKKSRCKRYHSMPPLRSINTPDKPNSNSKAFNGPFWSDVETQIEQQEKCQRSKNDLYLQTDSLHETSKKVTLENGIPKSNDTLIPLDGDVVELQRELDYVDNKNRKSRHHFRLSHMDSKVKQSNELIQALIDTQLSADRCEHQIQHLLEYWANVMKEGHQITICDISRIKRHFNDTGSILCEFKHSSCNLRVLLKHLQQQDAMAIESTIRANSLYCEKQMTLERINKELETDIIDKNNMISDLRKKLLLMNDDSINFSSTQESLENIKAHLQQQLKLKSGDCNRMAVQIRNLESRLFKEKLEKEHYVNHLKNPNRNAVDDRETLKKAVRAQKQKALKAEKRITEISSLLLEKETKLEQILSERHHGLKDRSEKNLFDRSSQCNLNVDVNKDLYQVDGVTEEQVMLDVKCTSPDHENVILLRKENDTLRLNIVQREEQLKMVQLKAEALQNNIKGGGDTTNDGLENVVLLIQKLEVSERNDQTNALRIKELEQILKDHEIDNIGLNGSLQQREKSVSDLRSKTDELVQENAALRRQLEAALTDYHRQSGKSPSNVSNKSTSFQSSILNLESQLAQQRSEVTKWRLNFEANEKQFQDRIQDIQVQLGKAESKNRSMEAYISYLKKSYANVFGDMPLLNGPEYRYLPTSGGPLCF